MKQFQAFRKIQSVTYKCPQQLSQIITDHGENSKMKEVASSYFPRKKIVTTSYVAVQPKPLNNSFTAPSPVPLSQNKLHRELKPFRENIAIDSEEKQQKARPFKTRDEPTKSGRLIEVNTHYLPIRVETLPFELKLLTNAKQLRNIPLCVALACSYEYFPAKPLGDKSKIKLAATPHEKRQKLLILSKETDKYTSMSKMLQNQVKELKIPSYPKIKCQFTKKQELDFKTTTIQQSTVLKIEVQGQQKIKISDALLQAKPTKQAPRQGWCSSESGPDNKLNPTLTNKILVKFNSEQFTVKIKKSFETQEFNKNWSGTQQNGNGEGKYIGRKEDSLNGSNNLNSSQNQNNNGNQNGGNSQNGGSGTNQQMFTFQETQKQLSTNMLIEVANIGPLIINQKTFQNKLENIRVRDDTSTVAIEAIRMQGDALMLAQLKQLKLKQYDLRNILQKQLSAQPLLQQQQQQEAAAAQKSINIEDFDQDSLNQNSNIADQEQNGQQNGNNNKNGMQNSNGANSNQDLASSQNKNGLQNSNSNANNQNKNNNLNSSNISANNKNGMYGSLPPLLYDYQQPSRQLIKSWEKSLSAPYVNTAIIPPGYFTNQKSQNLVEFSYIHKQDEEYLQQLQKSNVKFTKLVFPSDVKQPQTKSNYKFYDMRQAVLKKKVKGFTIASEEEAFNQYLENVQNSQQVYKEALFQSIEHCTQRTETLALISVPFFEQQKPQSVILDLTHTISAPVSIIQPKESPSTKQQLSKPSKELKQISEPVDQFSSTQSIKPQPATPKELEIPWIPKELFIQEKTVKTNDVRKSEPQDITQKTKEANGKPLPETRNFKTYQYVARINQNKSEQGNKCTMKTQDHHKLKETQDTMDEVQKILLEEIWELEKEVLSRQAPKNNRASYIYNQKMAQDVYEQLGGDIPYTDKNPRYATEADSYEEVLQNVAIESDTYVKVLQMLVQHQAGFNNPKIKRLEDMIDAETQFVEKVSVAEYSPLIALLVKEFDKFRKTYELLLLDLEQLKISMEAIINKCLDASTSKQNTLIETFNQLQKIATPESLNLCDQIQYALKEEEDFQEDVQTMNEIEQIFALYDKYIERPPYKFEL
ncbi:Conserved_hypothetical protein [Hexamita inflata]|uniref:Uncharacterized protein n=1 Tax=Hexamita inflata TaxID=28002 RepID=A0AA86UTR7_9EUKA|nr:Conserved hypothetical protein [Hexamita inflata]